MTRFHANLTFPDTDVQLGSKGTGLKIMQTLHDRKERNERDNCISVGCGEAVRTGGTNSTGSTTHEDACGTMISRSNTSRILLERTTGTCITSSTPCESAIWGDPRPSPAPSIQLRTVSQRLQPHARVNGGRVTKDDDHLVRTLWILVLFYVNEAYVRICQIKCWNWIAIIVECNIRPSLVSAKFGWTLSDMRIVIPTYRCGIKAEIGTKRWIPEDAEDTEVNKTSNCSGFSAARRTREKGTGMMYE
ncbi:hypothetical protein B0H14DRAFT_2565263 [Mycena olivaceomarginata]|nr:hypothetical protein B0H14DRAFT_2565263 [Mycena olivaceomarginata]